ncbi:MAG: hypothetical protein IJ482_03565 [Alphaproteobacteria bacterium]|nr:hypothetical protein [Alphaproteobacteria bacterium]
MKLTITALLLLSLAACSVGEFTPERHAQYESSVDCEKTPQRCVRGYPW